MPKYDVIQLGKKAKELGFVRDTFEKVDRLVRILRFINETPVLRDHIALKGGTSINLTVFDLPRLSVDIDLDFTENCSRDDMLQKRGTIKDVLSKYMEAEGYMLSAKSKFPHSLDSFVYSYVNAGGNKDNIKIEINYSMRCHIFEPEMRDIETGNVFDSILIRTLAPLEIFASKINALMSRAATRDLYDISNMIRFGIFDEKEKDTLKKCVLFYVAVGGKDILKSFTFEKLDMITQNTIKRDLYPVIRLGDGFELSSAKKMVMTYLKELINLNAPEHEFLKSFSKGKYMPQLLFDDETVIDRIKHHPMAEWKIKRIMERYNER